MAIALILAAGKADRCKNKLFQKVRGRKILEMTLDAFEGHEDIGRIVIMVHKKKKNTVANMVVRRKYGKVEAVLEGGETRQNSMEKGMQWMEREKAPFFFGDKEVIIIHNGANPCVSSREITEVIKMAHKYGSAGCGHAVTDTIKRVRNGKVMKTLDRNTLMAMQTPQAFRYNLLKQAIEKAAKEGLQVTDDLSLIEHLGEKPRIIEASPLNRKITYEEDMERLKLIMEMPRARSSLRKRDNRQNNNTLIGIGEDSHLFSREKGLMLGGAYFKEKQKLKANSDGDIILHALYNAISSSLGGGSIGKTADGMLEKNNVKNSREYLKPLLAEMKKRGLRVNNISVSIEGKTPKIDPLAPRITKSLAKIMSAKEKNIGLTATTGEDLTPFGQGKGMKCFVAITLR